jgi:Mg/Co/Ni transporter MgtE
MIKQDPFLNHHILMHAKEVHRLLSNYAIDEIYKLAASLPQGTAARLIAQLETGPRDSILGRFDASELGDILAEAATEDLHIISAVLSEERIAAVIHDADAENRIKLQMLLEHRKNTVSMRMTSNYLAFVHGNSIEHTISSVANTRHIGSQPIYCVDGVGDLLGEIDPFVLMQNRGSSKPLETLLQATPQLQASSSLLSALDADLWAGRKYLPVIDLQNRLVGTLSIEELKQVHGSFSTPEQLSALVASEYIRLMGDLAMALFGSQRR